MAQSMWCDSCAAYRRPTAIRLLVLPCELADNPMFHIDVALRFPLPAMAGLDWIEIAVVPTERGHSTIVEALQDIWLVLNGRQP